MEPQWSTSEFPAIPAIVVAFPPDEFLASIAQHLLPATVPVGGEAERAQLKNAIPCFTLPAHPTTAETSFEQLLAPGFRDTTADGQLGRCIFRILHMLRMGAKVVEMR